MAEMIITTQDLNQNGTLIKVVHFAGQLDETNVDAEAQKIYQMIDSMSPPNLLLDFSELSYMNSKSIGYVTDWYSRTAAKSGKITIAQPQANILDILKVVGITQIVDIHQNLEEAKNSFGGSASAPVDNANSTTPIAPPTPTPPQATTPASNPNPAPPVAAPANNPNPNPAPPQPTPPLDSTNSVNPINPPLSQ